EHRETVAILDQPHRDASDVRLERHACIHQRQTRAADGRHARAAVGFGDLGDDAYRVCELVGGRQHGDPGPLGEPSAADLAPLRASRLSMRGSPDKMSLRTCFASSSKSKFLTWFA